MTADRLDPAEFRCRVEAIGLDLADLAQLLGVGKVTARKWATGGAPIPWRVEGALNQIEEDFDTLQSDITQDTQDSPNPLTLTVYRTDAALHAAHPEWARHTSRQHRLATWGAVRSINASAGYQIAY